MSQQKNPLRTRYIYDESTGHVCDFQKNISYKYEEKGLLNSTAGYLMSKFLGRDVATDFSSTPAKLSSPCKGDSKQFVYYDEGVPKDLVFNQVNSFDDMSLDLVAAMDEYHIIADDVFCLTHRYEYQKEANQHVFLPTHSTKYSKTINKNVYIYNSKGEWESADKKLESEDIPLHVYALARRHVLGYYNPDVKNDYFRSVRDLNAQLGPMDKVLHNLRLQAKQFKQTVKKWQTPESTTHLTKTLNPVEKPPKKPYLSPRTETMSHTESTSTETDSEKSPDKLSGDESKESPSVKHRINFDSDTDDEHDMFFSYSENEELDKALEREAVSSLNSSTDRYALADDGPSMNPIERYVLIKSSKNEYIVEDKGNKIQYKYQWSKAKEGERPTLECFEKKNNESLWEGDSNTAFGYNLLAALPKEAGIIDWAYSGFDKTKNSHYFSVYDGDGNITQYLECKVQPNNYWMPFVFQFFYTKNTLHSSVNSSIDGEVRALASRYIPGFYERAERVVQQHRTYWRMQLALTRMKNQSDKINALSVSDDVEKLHNVQTQDLEKDKKSNNTSALKVRRRTLLRRESSRDARALALSNSREEMPSHSENTTHHLTFHSAPILRSKSLPTFGTTRDTDNRSHAPVKVSAPPVQIKEHREKTGDVVAPPTPSQKKGLERQILYYVLTSKINIRSFEPQLEKEKKEISRSLGIIILTSIKNVFDTAIAFPIAIALNGALNPFYQLAHDAWKISSTNEVLYRGNGIPLPFTVTTINAPRWLQILLIPFNTVLRIFVVMPVKFVLTAVLSIFQGGYLAIKAGFWGVKQKNKLGPHGQAGALPAALQMPLVNINNARKMQSKGAQAGAINWDSYHVSFKHLFVLSLSIALIVGTLAAVLVTAGVGVPILTAITGFVATKLGIVLSAALPVWFDALIVGAVAGFISTIATEIALYVLTNALYAVGYVMQAGVDGTKLLAGVSLEPLTPIVEKLALDSESEPYATEFHKSIFSRLSSTINPPVEGDSHDPEPSLST